MDNYASSTVLGGEFRGVGFERGLGGLAGNGGTLTSLCNPKSGRLGVGMRQSGWEGARGGRPGGGRTTS